MYYEATVIKTVIKNSIKSLEIDPNIYGQINFTKKVNLLEKDSVLEKNVRYQLDINLQGKKEEKEKKGKEERAILLLFTKDK